MATINFYLNNTNKDSNGFSPIIVRIREGLTAQCAKNLPYKIKPRYWNKKKQRVSPSKPGEPDNKFETINAFLDSYQGKASDYFNACLLQNISIDKSLIKDFLDGKQKLFAKKKFDSFFDVYHEFIELSKPSKAKNTIKGYNLTCNFLKRFDEGTKYNLSFDKINLHFFDALKNYAFDNEDVEINYFATIISKLKVFLNWCYERGYTDNLNHSKFSAPEKEKPVICLDVDEFKALFQYKMPSKKLEKAKDIFCFGCLTGLRYEDMKQLRKEHIQGDYIVKLTEKTEAITKIPILEPTKRIIEKYSELGVYILPTISNQKFSDYIKECCKIAGIDKPTMKVSYKGNKTEETPFPKYELISAHNSRKTFITLSFYYGLDAKTIMEIATIKKDKILTKYLKISDELKKEKMQAAWGKLDL